MHNLVSAAAATGVNRSTILRAIKAGRISAQRDETNGWQIDPAELHRVFPPLPSGATTATQLGATTDALVAELRAVIADLRRDRDAWREAFENAQRLLPRPTQPDAIAMPGLSNTPPAATEVTISPRLALDAGNRVPCGRGLVARLIDRARGCSTAAAATGAAAGMLHG